MVEIFWDEKPSETKAINQEPCQTTNENLLRPEPDRQANPDHRQEVPEPVLSADMHLTAGEPGNVCLTRSHIQPKPSTFNIDVPGAAPSPDASQDASPFHSSYIRTKV